MKRPALRADLLYTATVYVAVSAALTFAHVNSVDLPHVREQRTSHDAIVNARSVRPYNIRVLQPLLVQALVNAIPPRLDNRAFLAGYASIRFLSLLATFTVAEGISVVSRAGTRRGSSCS